MVRIPVREGKKKKIPDLKLSHTVLRYRPVRGDWCTGGWSHRWVRSGGSTSEGDFLGSLTGGTWVALPVSPTSDYTEHPFATFFPYFFATFNLLLAILCLKEKAGENAIIRYNYLH